MKEIYKKHNMAIKILLLGFCFIIFAGKVIYDFSPYILIENAFENTVNKHKSFFSQSLKTSNPLSARLCYETSRGKSKIINAVFDDSVIGVSLDGPDSVYYTIPIENIKNILKSDYVHSFFQSGKVLAKSSNPALVIPALFSLEFNKNADLKLLAKSFSKVQLVNNKGSFLSKEKSFSFVIPSQSLAEIIEYVFCSRQESGNMLKKSLADIICVKDGDYLFDIEISADSLKKIKCITPLTDSGAYIIQLNFDHAQICLSIENDLDDGSDEKMIFSLSSQKGRKGGSYKEKSIYSLTIGDLVKLSKSVSDSQ